MSSFSGCRASNEGTCFLHPGRAYLVAGTCTIDEPYSKALEPDFQIWPFLDRQAAERLKPVSAKNDLNHPAVAEIFRQAVSHFCRIDKNGSFELCCFYYKAFKTIILTIPLLLIPAV